MSPLKRLITLVLLLGMPLGARSATNRCDLLTRAEVATVLPKAGEPGLPEWAPEAPPTWGLCEWSGGGLVSLTVGANKDSRLLRSFNEKGAQKVDKLGDRAVFEVIGSGLIVSGSRLTVLAGDRIVALSIVGIDVETAKQMRPALEKLVRRVLERL